MFHVTVVGSFLVSALFCEGNLLTGVCKTVTHGLKTLEALLFYSLCLKSRQSSHGANVLPKH